MEICNQEYCVYAHINKTNGKIYIGQTCQKPEKRWRRGQGYWHNQHFWNAIEKYGWNGFEHKIIASNLTFDEANNLEKLLIEKLDTMNPDKGYNCTSGGNKKKTISEETRKRLRESHLNYSEEMIQRMRERMSGKNHPNYGKHLSEETKRKISNTLIGHPVSEETRCKMSVWQIGKESPRKGIPLTEEHKRKLSENHADVKGENGPMYGKHHTKESRQKMHDTHVGKTLSQEHKDKISQSHKNRCRLDGETRNRKVIRLSDLKVYDKVKDAAYDNQTSSSTILYRCKQHLEFMYYGDYLSSL